MKTENGRRLWQIIQDAAHEAGVNHRRFRDQFDVDELFDEIAGISDAWVIASAALNRMCRSEGGYNNNGAGVKAVMRFLSELCSQEPVSLSDVGDCLLDLRNALGAGTESGEEIGKWIDRWYQF